MHTISAFEAKTSFYSLLARAEKGEHIIITKEGRAVAQLSPVVCWKKKNILAAIQNIKKFQQQHKLEMDWKELRDEERK